MTMLVERLAGTSRGGGSGAVRESILANLRWMCGTRRGTVRGRPDYGLPDIQSMVHSFPDAVAELQRALEHNIRTYEPRLTNVEVKHIPGTVTDLIVRFEIRASLRATTSEPAVRFETALSATHGPTVT
jgi:type VI secretion system protein